MAATTRNRKKLDPDPAVRGALLTAALHVIGERGVRELTVAEVLSRAKLGTRAFYRHFTSKDELVAAAFLEKSRVEARRLRRRMDSCDGPIDTVVAWIDSRLDLAFDDKIRSDQQALSREAQSAMFAAPEIVNEAYGELLTPLIEQLEGGRRDGVFPGIDPATTAHSIQGAVWACVERQWATPTGDRAEVRARLARFCVQGLTGQHY